MLTTDQAWEISRRRVFRSAINLDSIDPDWDQHVDIDTLDLSSPENCVCGQWRGWYAAMDTLGFNPDPLAFDRRTVTNGFMGDSNWRMQLIEGIGGAIPQYEISFQPQPTSFWRRLLVYFGIVETPQLIQMSTVCSDFSNHVYQWQYATLTQLWKKELEIRSERRRLAAEWDLHGPHTKSAKKVRN